MSFHRSIVLLLLAWVPASGQQPAEAPPAPITPAPPGVPIPGAPAPPAAGGPGAKPPAPGPLKPMANLPPVQPGIPLGDNKITEDIIEPKLSGNALAGLYRRYTGRRVLVTAAASAAEFSFVQEASAQDPLTFASAAELLRKAAVLESFVFVQHPQDPLLDVLTLATGGTRPTGVVVDVYNENSTLPETDVVITYVMTLSHIKPDQAVNIFTQVVGQLGAYGSISAVPNASAVIITEKASLISSLVELKNSIDVPGSVQSTRFIKVQYADVTEIATTLTELLTAQQSTQKTAGIQRTDAGVAAPPAGGVAQPGAAAGVPGSSGAGEETPVQIIPEPRTNRIFAMGRPVDLLFVEGLIREFDVPTSDKTFLRRKLRFLTVSDFLPIASDALTRAFSGAGEGGGSTGGAAGAQGGRTQTNNRQPTTARSSGPSGSSSGIGGSSSGLGGSSTGSSGFGGGSSSGGMGGGRGGLGGSVISAAPESVLVGRTLLVADNITNSIVVQGPPSGLEIIERLLDQIDVKPDQVMISTVIGQLTFANNREFGMDYLYRGGDVVARGGGGLGPILPILPLIPSAATAAATDFHPGSLSSGAGLQAYGKVGDLSVYLKALQSKTDFTVLSRPSIFTSNNQPGTISSGERIAIPTSSNSFSTGGASTNIEYQDVVLKLEVIPLVNSDNEITMQIYLLSDEQNGVQRLAGAGSNGEDLEVPRISTRELVTTATVPNAETIVLGGLIVNKKNEEKSGIPILSDIPYLGRLFSTSTNRDDRSELMVFIQPTIVKNDRSLNDVQIDMNARYKVSADAHKFGNGNGVLPGVDEIPRVEATGKGGGSGNAVPPKAIPAATTSPMKSSFRPAHRK
jgi:general secretion pathway protein D